MAADLALHNSKITELILLNPAIIPPEIDITLLPKEIPLNILKGMQRSKLFEQKIKARIHIFNGNNDEVVPPEWPVQFARIQEANILFLDDGHRLTQHLKQLPKIISTLLRC